MLEAEKLALGRFRELGWAAQRQPFSATNVAATLDYGDSADFVYPRQEGANLVAVREGEEDTSVNFRYPHYHRPTDTPEKLDYERLADITAAAAVVIARAASLIVK